MHKLFSLDGHLFAILGKTADLILLNVLWVLCCLPIVTIGASTTALYSVSLKLFRNEESYIIRSFFHAFKENLRQASILWMMVLLTGGFLSYDMFIVNQLPSSSGSLSKTLLSIALLLFFLMLNYLFPLLAKFQNSVKNICINALLMSLLHFPYTLLIMAATFIPALLMCRFPVVFVYGIFIYLFIGGALTAFVNAFLFERIFPRYIPFS